MSSCAADRAKRDFEAWEQDLAHHWNLSPDFLRQGQISHQCSDENRAVWGAEGGIVSCSDATPARVVTEIICRDTGNDYTALVRRLQDALGQVLPGVACRIDISLYRYDQPGALVANVGEAVETLSPRTPGLPDLPEKVEHVFAIREGSAVLSWACNIPQLRVDEHWLHSVGVGTHPDHRGKGFGKAVVSALLEHVAAEDGAALWVCEASNVLSLKLALSVGFKVHFCVLNWKVG